MLERSSVGYKGLIPRISYSRYFSIDKSASSDRILQETGFSNHIGFCSRDSRQKNVNYDKIKSRKVFTNELKKKGVPITDSQNDTSGKKYLLPPPQKFRSTTVRNSPREKLQTDNTRTDVKAPVPMPSVSSMCKEFFGETGRCGVCLKSHNDYQATENQQTKSKSIDKRPSSTKSIYQFTDSEEMQREKIINSWMQFFG